MTRQVQVHAIKLVPPPQWAMQVLKDSAMEQPSNNIKKGLNLHNEQMRKLHIWPLGIIPYYIDDLSFDKALRDTIRLYFDNVNRVTGLRFTEIPRPPEDDKSRWVFFINRRGQLDCADLAFHNFTNIGVQRVVLGYDCLANGKMSSVVLSLIGVPPQHNAPNRNKFITINEKNILPDKLYLFEKLKDDVWLFNNLTYDYYSAGHYGTHQYTSNGGETVTYVSQPEKMRSLSKDSAIGFSLTDLRKINMLYNNIITKRETSVKVPGCDQLFDRGSKLKYPKSNMSDHIETSKESNEYPKPQDVMPTENSFVKETDNYSAQNGPGQFTIGSKEDFGDNNEDENKSEKQLSTENKVDYDDNQAELSNTKKTGKNDIDVENNQKLRDKLLLAHINKKENILNESDYETDPEGNKKIK
ncbi:unnamed protein product [Euphydryas editha]|uniref:Metalloendopeptidase n=1 Tax=Euphydryas editha TaxID=104508 RepID=A0AAU9V0X7_EUPED|nr:unnamed protein product [Euphydryas editha]